MYAQRLTAAAVAVLSMCAGCALLSSGPRVPGWVRETPRSKSAIYGVGCYPRTRFEHEARTLAKDDAREEVAKTISVRIQGVFVDWETSSSTGLGGGYREEFVASISKEALDVAMTGSQIQEVWCDEEGAVSAAGTWWALARLDKASLAHELLETAQAVKSQIGQQGGAKSPEDQAKIEEQAQDAFADLDKRLKNME